MKIKLYLATYVTDGAPDSYHYFTEEERLKVCYETAVRYLKEDGVDPAEWAGKSPMDVLDFTYAEHFQGETTLTFEDTEIDLATLPGAFSTGDTVTIFKKDLKQS